MWKNLLKTALFVGGIYVCIAALTLIFSNILMFPSPRATYQLQDADYIRLQSSHGNEIIAKWFPNPNASCTILYSHGNAVDLGGLNAVLEHIAGLGFNILAYDYQGYGQSQGSASEQRTYDDIKAAYQYLTTIKKIPANKIILYGHSIGTGPTIELARQIQPEQGVILQAPFLSAYRVVIQWPILPYDKYKNFEKVSEIHVPILVLHGSLDNVIPIHHGEGIHALANHAEEALWIEKAGHNNLIKTAGERFDEKIKQFASQCFQ